MSSASSGVSLSSLSKAVPLLLSDLSLLALAGAQACFEGGLYLFLFLWTPALYTPEEMTAEQTSDTLPQSSAQHLGLIFSTLVVCLLLGAGVARGMQSSNRKAVGRLPLYVHLLACFSMVSAATVSENKAQLYGAYLLFLVAAGLFYPAYGAIKVDRIGEEVRSGVINAVRLPVLLLVSLLLLHSEQVSFPLMFAVCALIQVLGFGCYVYHYFASGNSPAVSSSVEVSVLCEERVSLIPKLESRTFAGATAAAAAAAGGAYSRVPTTDA